MQKRKNKKPKTGKVFKFKYLFLDIVRFIGWWKIWIVLRPKIRYEKGATRKIKGRAIITSNHSKWMEAPLMITVFIKRRLFFVMAKEIFRGRFLKWFFTEVGCIPIDRTAFDMQSYNSSIDVLKDERALVIFPEGKLEMNDEIQPFKAGVALMSLQTNSPVVPVYIDKEFSFSKRAQIIIGKAVYPSDVCDGKLNVANAEIITNYLYEKTKQLKETLRAERAAEDARKGRRKGKNKNTAATAAKQEK